jgi:solute carrier family 25 phosphate transporter 3
LRILFRGRFVFFQTHAKEKMKHHDCCEGCNDEIDCLASSVFEGSLSRNVSYSLPYIINNDYTKCLVGGALASSIRWVLTPFDNVKCKMQIHPSKYPSLRSGLLITWKEQGLTGLYRGLGPTVLAYSSQTGTKYMMYEVLKDTWVDILGPETCNANRDLIYILSAAGAEAIADVAMAPWEMIKVKVQTTPNFPTHLAPALATMVRHRQHYQFPFGALRPLWSRQIVGTVANFYVFERMTEYIYSNILSRDKNTYSSATQLMVTCASGCVAGVTSAVVSHPFDVLVSLQTQHPDKTLAKIVQDTGWRNLFTRGLGPRVGLTASILCVQWFLYDSFKTMLGMTTTGGGKFSN